MIPMRGAVRLRSVWIVVALLEPPCQERNPEFDGVGGTNGAAEGGASSTAATSGSEPTGTGDAAEGDGGATSAASGTDAADTTITPDATGPATTTGDPDTGATTAGGCPDPMVICAGLCVDVMSNPDHCGNCDNKCNPAHETCARGECVPD